ncbi:hypothetical protein [Actinoplanes sp. ATCC 53533]|uniref:hypothetical protein n=1 Tax=Actinoplanes sp. ATCC 53533 TaxID=1288362 RepID=UPI001F293618|nr:hypothetical protein [Actinoplanes sp. ATCC 53533]
MTSFTPPSPQAPTAQVSNRPAADAETDPEARRSTGTGLLLLIAGLIGGAAAFTLAVEKVLLLKNPTSQEPDVQPRLQHQPDPVLRLYHDHQTGREGLSTTAETARSFGQVVGRCATWLAAATTADSQTAS